MKSKIDFKLIPEFGLRQGETEHVLKSNGDMFYILIKQTGEITVNRFASKVLLIRDWEKGDVLLCGWHGQYRTDMFEMDVPLIRKSENYLWYKKKHPEDFER